MTYMKFECPACGQSLECDRAFGGDVIHCPRCCAEIRVPFGADQQLEGSLSRAELISQPAVATAPSGQPIKTANEQVNQPDAAPPQPSEVKCPVCHAELRIPAGLAPKAGEKLPAAELIREGPRREANAEHAKPAKPPPQTESPHLSIEEREQKIAAARKEHPVQVYPPMKPRLEYVLSGEAPPPATNENSAPKPPQQSDQEPNDTKSFNE
jgi:hypothetical protein